MRGPPVINLFNPKELKKKYFDWKNLPTPNIESKLAFGLGYYLTHCWLWYRKFWDIQDCISGPESNYIYPINILLFMIKSIGGSLLFIDFIFAIKNKVSSLIFIIKRIKPVVDLIFFTKSIVGTRNRAGPEKTVLLKNIFISPMIFHIIFSWKRKTTYLDSKCRCKCQRHEESFFFL